MDYPGTAYGGQNSLRVAAGSSVELGSYRSYKYSNVNQLNKSTPSLAEYTWNQGTTFLLMKLLVCNEHLVYSNEKGWRSTKEMCLRKDTPWGLFFRCSTSGVKARVTI